jgi:low temperature requirement protein LtrA
MAKQPPFRLRTRMVARDTKEAERVSSPLELLFDLTFVVAVAQVATQFASQVEHGTGVSSILPFLMVFFAIWWAWMNFTWFASAYDTDDIQYRLLVLLQMAGVLVLAAGVPAAFHSGNYLGITLGYFIMRVGLVAQWIRAGIEDRNGRRTAFRYAAGITVVQIGWVLRLVLPTTPAAVPYTVYLAFIVLAGLDLSVPRWAERTGGTNWHPHHIAERYGLFTIILLGEGVASLAGGIGLILNTNAPTVPLVAIGVSGLVLLFALWWLYFLQAAGDGLEAHRGASFFWGYGHYFVFVALAALGGGLDVAVAGADGALHLSPVVTAYTVAVPVALYLIALWVVHAPIVPKVIVRVEVVAPFALVILLLPLAAPALGVPAVIGGITLATALVVVATIAIKHHGLAPQE